MTDIKALDAASSIITIFIGSGQLPIALLTALPSKKKENAKWKSNNHGLISMVAIVLIVGMAGTFRLMSGRGLSNAKNV